MAKAILLIRKRLLLEYFEILQMMLSRDFFRRKTLNSRTYMKR